MNQANGLIYRAWKGLEWRIRGPAEKTAWAIRCWLLYRLAFAYRPLLKRTAFVGITGSAGKTTAKDLLASILDAHWGDGAKGRGSFSFPYNIAGLVVGTRMSAPYCVTEIGLSSEFPIDLSLALFRPTVGVVTNIGYDHMSAYGGRDGVVREKSKLVRALPTDGIAVLNADDPLVMGMRANSPGRTVTYGLNENADLRGEMVEASWPDRLSLTARWNGESVRVSTQLCGSHWASAVLSALATGVAMGVPLQEAARVVGKVEPYDGRMQPVTTSDGITFIRDDFKAPLWTLDASLEFMHAARAERKIIVIGELSDVGTGTGKAAKYLKAANQALAVADIVVFVGPWSSSVLKARRPGNDDALRVFSHVRDAAAYIDSIARSGDLILLKGTTRQDHLQRIILSRNGNVACWRDDCNRVVFCDTCPELGKPSGAHLVEAPQKQPETPVALPAISLDPAETVIVGMGNPEAKYDGTPHNIGFACVDYLAASLALHWEELPDAWMARGTVDGRAICLIKTRTYMNLTGGVLKQLSDGLSFTPGQCILVYDDLDLPLGTVRRRMAGSAGGHRGVASVLEAFQTNAFRRVKIGVGKVGATNDRVNYVLSPFDASDSQIVGKSLVSAAGHVLEMAALSR